MATKLDTTKLDPKQYKQLVAHLRRIRDLGYQATEELDHIKTTVESAIDWTWNNKIPSSLLSLAAENSQGKDLPSAEQLEADRESDEYIVLKDPFMSRLFLSWHRAIKNRNLNPRNEWLELDRDHDTFLVSNGLRDFIPQANQAIVNYYTAENKKFKFRRKYAKLSPEFVAHGYTVGQHVWNSKDDYCDIVAPGTRNFAVFPITDDMRKTNKCIRYPITYGDLIKNSEYDTIYLKKYIKPAYVSSAEKVGDTDRKEFDETFQRDGTLLVTEIHIPSLYLEDEEGDPVIETDLVFHVLFDPQTTKAFERDRPNDGITDVILTAYKEVKTDEAGIVVETFNDTFPEDFPGKGPLIPFLYDQAHLNQLKQNHVRLVEMLSDPAFTEEDLDGIDDEDTEDQEIVPGARFKNKKIDLLLPPSIVAGINALIQASKMIKEDNEGAQGMNKNAQGQPLPGRRSAAEVDEMNSNSTEAVQDVVNQFDNVLRSSHLIRMYQTSLQVRARLAKMLNIEIADVDTFDPDLLNKALAQNKLFQRMKAWSEIEVFYADFYKDHNYRLEEEQTLLLHIENAEIQKKKIVEQISQGYQNNSPEEQERVDMLEQQRQQLASQISQMVDSLEGLEPIPEASDYLFYRILTPELSESDVEVVAGHSDVKVKEAKDTLELLLNYADRYPEIRARVEFKKVIGHLSRILKKKPREFLKSSNKLAQIDRRLEAMENAPPQQEQQ